MHDRKTQKQIERTKAQNDKKNGGVHQSLEKRIFQEINRNTLSKLNVVQHPVLSIAYIPRAYCIHTHIHTRTCRIRFSIVVVAVAFIFMQNFSFAILFISHIESVCVFSLARLALSFISTRMNVLVRHCASFSIFLLARIMSLMVRLVELL